MKTIVNIMEELSRQLSFIFWWLQMQHWNFGAIVWS
jgi:hypothetical protein